MVASVGAVLSLFCRVPPCFLQFCLFLVFVCWFFFFFVFLFTSIICFLFLNLSFLFRFSLFIYFLSVIHHSPVRGPAWRGPAWRDPGAIFASVAQGEDEEGATLEPSPSGGRSVLYYKALGRRSNGEE